MSKISWDPIYSVKVKEIDDQHRRFIAFMNEAYDKLEKGPVPESFADFFTRLKNHAKEHFATEEGYFQKFNYPDAVEHIREHGKLKLRIMEFEKKFESGLPSTTIVFETIQFLDDWLFDHIVRYDRKFTECFNKHGLH